LAGRNFFARLVKLAHAKMRNHALNPGSSPGRLDFPLGLPEIFWNTRLMLQIIHGRMGLA